MMIAFALVLTLKFVAEAADCELCQPIDLGRSLSSSSVAETIPFIPGNISESTIQGRTYRTNDFFVGEHTGTHLDAPYHFYEDGWTVDQIPLYRLITNAIFLNLTEEVDGNPNFRLEPYHIEEWIDENGPLPGNAIVLISYGWSQRYSDREAYLGTSSINKFDHHFPGMSTAAAVMLAEMKQVVAVGVDTPCVDYPGSTDARAVLSVVNVYSVLNVDLNLPCLPERGFQLYTMPLKIVAGTGSPCRVIAVPHCGPKQIEYPVLEKPHLYEDYYNIL